MSSSVPGTVSIPMINGRGWEFEHDGTRYQIVSLDDVDHVRLYYRRKDDDAWQFGHARDTNGHGAAWVAKVIHQDIIAPVGVSYARDWLATSTLYSRDQVRNLSNNNVIVATSERYPGGWDGMLRDIGAV